MRAAYEASAPSVRLFWRCLIQAIAEHTARSHAHLARASGPLRQLGAHLRTFSFKQTDRMQ